MSTSPNWLHRLKTKWKVNSITQVVIILCTFAIGGSMCGMVGKKIIHALQLDNALLSGALYFLLITLLWPVSVLIVSVPLGQFKFFKNYLAKIWSRISGR